MGWFRDWRRSRVLQQARLDAGLWQQTIDRYDFLRVLSRQEQVRLKDHAVLFLHEKVMHGAGGLTLRDDMRIAIAAQACILILNLDVDFYRGWVDIIVYPDEFVAEYEFTDDDGVVHAVKEPITGESWLGGPLILSWADADGAGQGTGYNVVIHEFAHKIDMLNGDANGYPPLHADMSRSDWVQAFTAAYEQLCVAVERGEETAIDAYAGEDPSEFFAVMSEAFFELPVLVQGQYPGVYHQLCRFYRQDPAARLGRTCDASSLALVREG
jgi:Mlc titration factor MtfA (ptsG expression regulator)